MTKRLELPKFQAFDGNGDPLSGGLVYTYEVGTTTGKTSYSDYNAATPNANPVVLDSRGEADIYVQGTYKIVLKTSAGATLWTLDNVQGGIGPSGSEVGENYQYPDASAADQGVTGNSNTVKYAVDTISTDTGTIFVKHSSSDAETTYTLTTSETIPVDIALEVENGAVIDGAGTLTIDGKLIAGRYQIFGSTITVAFGEGSVDVIYPEWWGAVADGSTDSTDAIQAALDVSNTGGTNANRIPVSFGIGDYMAAELDHDGQTLMIGFEVGISRLIYNGSGGNDSYLIGYNVAAPTSYLPWGGYKNLSLEGYISGGEISEHIWKNIGTSGIDIFAKFENCQFKNCFGDAIYQTSTSAGVVNWHLNRVRFDGVGGWCVHVEVPTGHENRPLHMTEFTVDNNMETAFGVKAAADGYYDGTHWGKGLLYVVSVTGGINISLEEGRIELNKSLDIEGTYRPCVVLTETTSGYFTVLLKNVVGYFLDSDAGIVVYAADDKTHFSYINSAMGYSSALFENDSGYNIIGHAYGMGSYTDIGAGFYNQNYGIRLQDRQIEFQDHTGQTFNKYKSGDIMFNTDPELGGNAGWIMTAPADGVSANYYYLETLSSTAACTAASAVITLSSAAEMYKFPVNHGVTLIGAGGGAADLDTSVVSVDEENAQFTVADAVSTSVDPLTIKTIQGTFTPFGIINLQGSDTWDPGSIDDGNEEAKEVTVTGAALGDFAIASFSLDVSDLVLDAQVTAVDTVTCVLANNTSGAIDLGSGTVYVKVIKK